MLFEIETEKIMDQVCQDLEKEVVNHKFGVMTAHNLKEAMRKKGVEFERECRIFELCNPHQAKKVLEKHDDFCSSAPSHIGLC